MLPISGLIDKYEQGTEVGEDPFLRGAPALMIIYARKKTSMLSLDAGIAGYHMNLAYETMGIGTVWNGFHSIMANKFKSMRNLSLLPKKQTVLASICLGYPKLKFQRNCTRRHLRYEIIDESKDKD